MESDNKTEHTPEENVPLQPSITPNKKAQKQGLGGNRWYDLGIQTVAIFLSITLSFAVNQCQENHKNKELETFYLKQILADLEEDINEIEGDIKNYQWVSNGYAFFQNYDWQANKTPDSLQIYSQIFFTESTPNINNLGFETLRGMGKLDIISNKKILTQLMTIYQEKLPSLRLSIDVYFHLRRELILPYLTDHLVITPAQPYGDYLKLLPKSEFRMRILLGSVTQEILQRYRLTQTEYLLLREMINAELKSRK